MIPIITTTLRTLCAFAAMTFACTPLTTEAEPLPKAGDPNASLATAEKSATKDLDNAITAYTQGKSMSNTARLLNFLCADNVKVTKDGSGLILSSIRSGTDGELNRVAIEIPETEKEIINYLLKEFCEKTSDSNAAELQVSLEDIRKTGHATAEKLTSEEQARIRKELFKDIAIAMDQLCRPDAGFLVRVAGESGVYLIFEQSEPMRTFDGKSDSHPVYTVIMPDQNGDNGSVKFCVRDHGIDQENWVRYTADLPKFRAFMVEAQIITEIGQRGSPSISHRLKHKDRFDRQMEMGEGQNPDLQALSHIHTLLGPIWVSRYE